MAHQLPLFETRFPLEKLSKPFSYEAGKALAK